VERKVYLLDITGMKTVSTVISHFSSVFRH
jgi:hypothetical protein